jgi:hypothetical protein
LVERVLGDQGFRQRVLAIKDKMVAAGGLHRAADIAEEALRTRRPVER